MIRCLSVRSLALAATALGLSAAAHAQSTVTVYGLVDVAVGQFQAAGQPKNRAVESGNMTTSFLGFKGSEDIGGGVKAVFALEHFFRPDTGEAARFTGDAFWARSAFVGLSGEFGTTALGRQTTPLFVSTLAFNPFGDSFSFSPAIRHYYTDALLGDSGWSNALGYSSNAVNGFSINVLGTDSKNTATSKGRNLGANALYFSKTLSASLAWQDVRDPVGAAVNKQTTFQLGASYDFGRAKLYGQLGQVKTYGTVADEKAKLYDFGVSVPLGLGEVLAAYGHSKTEFFGSSITNKTLSLGYDHKLSKRSDLYAVYMNDRVTSLESGNTFAVGMRHTF
ncbi:MAG: hypothetical protein RLZZ618_2548 [Pseudomonadota bacterium]|jgi:predicted porin